MEKAILTIRLQKMEKNCRIMGKNLYIYKKNRNFAR